MAVYRRVLLLVAVLLVAGVAFHLSSALQPRMDIVHTNKMKLDLPPPVNAAVGHPSFNLSHSPSATPSKSDCASCPKPLGCRELHLEEYPDKYLNPFVRTSTRAVCPITKTAPPRILFGIMLDCKRDLTLARSTLQHYARLGIQPQDMHFTLHKADLPETDPTMKQLAKECDDIAAQFGAFHTSVYGAFHASRKHRVFIEALRAMDVRRKDWIMHADVDEMQMYPTSLQEFVSDAEKRGFTWTFGYLIDRIALDGSLDNNVEGDTKVLDQFPWCCNITRNILQATTQKLLLWRAFLLPRSGGFHYIKTLNGKHSRDELGGGGYPVFHLKWTKGVVEYLRNDQLRKNAPLWRSETERIRQYLEEKNWRVDVTNSNLCSNATVFLKDFAQERLSSHNIQISRVRTLRV